MIAVYPEYWINSYMCKGYSFILANVPAYRILFTRSPSGRKPYVFSWKPPDLPKNLCGNRETNHLQGHGQLFIGRSFSYDDSSDSPNVLQFPGGPRMNFNSHVPFINGFSFEDIFEGKTLWEEGDRTRCLVRVVCIGRLFVVFIGSFTFSHYHGWSSGDKKNAYLYIERFELRDGRRYLYRSSDPDIPAGNVDATLGPTWKDYLSWVDSIEQLYRQASWQQYDWYREYLSPQHDYDWGFQSSQLSVLKGYLYAYMDRVDPGVKDEDFFLGNATQDAAQRVRYFDGNTPVYLKELFELRDSIAALIDLLKGEVNLKSVSSLYLNAKYGLRLTFQDTLDLGESIARKYDDSQSGNFFSVSRGRFAQDDIVACCKLYYDPSTRNGFAKVMAHLMEWDIFPSLQNVWDMVPYSFVVDWFADVEGFLNSIDTRTYLSVLNIFSCCYSIKYRWKVDIPSSHYGLHGRIEATRYKRFNRSTVIEPRATFSGGDPSDHIAEGAALIIQRL